MTVKYKAHTDKDSGIVKPLVRARQKCNECGKLVKPLFQPTRNPKDWLWLDCHICRSLLCEDCCGVTAEGFTECLLCYQTRLVREGRDFSGVRPGLRLRLSNIRA
jgi:hypothetical protein